MTLSAGDRLGRYEILGPLGAAGMGKVHRARDTEVERDVAIKVLPEVVSQDPDRLSLFKREAKAVARLVHPKKWCQISGQTIPMVCGQVGRNCL